MHICLAKTRAGGVCQLAGNPKNGRCHLHGGASTGPKTAEGRARIAAAQYKHGRRSKAYVAAQRVSAECKFKPLIMIHFFGCVGSCPTFYPA